MMQKFTRVDSNGHPTAFFSPDVHGEYFTEEDGVYSVHPAGLLADCVEIPTADWQAHIDGDKRQFVSGEWVPYTYTPTLDESKKAQMLMLSAACRAQIRAGLVSGALGANHRYDTDKDTDQTNLLAAGLGGVDIDYTCTDVATSTKMPRPHTATQIRQVFDEARDEKVRLVGLYHTLRGQVEAVAITTTLEAAQVEINAIAWTG